MKKISIAILTLILTFSICLLSACTQILFTFNCNRLHTLKSTCIMHGDEFEIAFNPMYASDMGWYEAFSTSLTVEELKQQVDSKKLQEGQSLTSETFGEDFLLITLNSNNKIHYFLIARTNIFEKRKYKNVYTFDCPCAIFRINLESVFSALIPFHLLGFTYKDIDYILDLEPETQYKLSGTTEQIEKFYTDTDYYEVTETANGVMIKDINDNVFYINYETKDNGVYATFTLEN